MKLPANWVEIAVIAAAVHITLNVIGIAVTKISQSGN